MIGGGWEGGQGQPLEEGEQGEMRRESQAGLVVGGGLSCQAREFGFSYAE